MVRISSVVTSCLCCFPSVVKAFLSIKLWMQTKTTDPELFAHHTDQQNVNIRGVIQCLLIPMLVFMNKHSVVTFTAFVQMRQWGRNERFLNADQCSFSQIRKRPIFSGSVFTPRHVKYLRYQTNSCDSIFFVRC